jgi:hypothetical protein
MSPKSEPPYLTSLGMPLARIYGESAKPWPRILQNYDDMVAANSAFKPVSDLAHSLASSQFVSAGLCALTSHSDLLLGPSTHLLDNPYLHIAYDFDQGRFLLTYLDGSAEPWSRTVGISDVLQAVSQFLIREARWFKQAGQ